MGRFHRHDDGTAHAHADLSAYDTERERVQVLEAIFGENDRCAARNRADLARGNTCAINVMSSPGAGKTTLLREALLRLRDRLRIGIVEGDIETSLDADRLQGLGATIELVNTGAGFGGECHLDATMVRSALSRLPLPELDLLLIENVGNLVCPAEFDVGEHARAMIHAITEGDDKPLKYPVMFRSADVVLVNKMDLLPHLDVDLALFRRNLAAVNPHARVLELSARTGDGVDAWRDWLVEQVVRSRSA